MPKLEVSHLDDISGRSDQQVDRSGGGPRRVFTAEALTPEPARERPNWFVWLWRGLCAIVEWLFGLASLILILSILATIPVLQFLSLGFLLEASGRVIHTRRIRDGFIGIKAAGRVGSICLGVVLTLLPVKFFSSLWFSSLLLNGNSGHTRVLRFVVLALGLAALLHIGWATFRGGRLRHFLWPAPVKFLRRIKVGGMYDEAANGLLEYFGKLRLTHYFWLGIRGFFGASIWLFVPVTLMVLATKADDPGFGGLMALVGGILLALVLLYLPFLQARLPMTNRFASQFQVRAVRDQFKRAPFAYWFSLFMTLTLAIPLYLLKAELIPREAAWLPSLVFVTFMYPARLAVGWAVARAEKRERPRIWVSRWLAWLGLLPVTLIYSLVVYFTQFTSWHGSLSLYEQHAFLVPVPFLGF